LFYITIKGITNGTTTRFTEIAAFRVGPNTLEPGSPRYVKRS